MWTWIFWLLVAGVVYTYLGYAAVLWIFRRKKPHRNEPLRLPRVTHIVAAYNEEQDMQAKIGNMQAIQYPQDLIRHVVITDGSTDNTPAIAAAAQGITHLHQPKREGKVAAINRAVAQTGDTDVLVFSDANAMVNPDAFLLLVNHLQHHLVGGVAGEKKVTDQGMVPGQAESLYWKYESKLKQLDADFHTVVGAAGELFCIRRTLFTPIPDQVLLDDLYLSLMVCKKGMIMEYEPRAIASEAPSLSIEDERIRRIRIGAGAFQSLHLFGSLLNIFRYGKLSFQFFSHRVMRWVVCPFALPLIFLLNTFFVFQDPNNLYLSLFLIQLLFYGMALIGSGVARRRSGSVFFLLPYYFVFMNAGLLAGLYRYLSGNQPVTWEKSKRAVLR